MEVIGLIISILAISISVATALFEYIWNKKINVINLEADLHKSIYTDFLVKKIPEARSYIVYSDEQLKETDKLIETLNDMRRASLFYKYEDKAFYDNLTCKLQELENKLVKKTGIMSNDEFSSFHTSINSDISDIYDIIMNKYRGKRAKTRRK